MNKNMEPKDVMEFLCTKISEKYIRRVIGKDVGEGYPQGYADGLQDIMSIIDELVKDEIEGRKKADQVKSKEESDVEKLTADFFRRIS